MKRLNLPTMISLLLVTITGSASAQATSDFESVHATSQSFVSSIRARDIEAMDKVWRHESCISFIRPLSTTVVVGMGRRSQGLANPVWPIRPRYNLNE